jgi:catecholate siderophore receptor
LTDNFRNTGYFNDKTTSLQVPFNDPTTSVAVTWRQSATDADNHLRLNLGAGFVQDQVEFTKWLQAIVGVRYDHFGLTYYNNRNGDTLTRVDRVVSPRLGLVLKPVTPLSIYTSYSVSYLPSSGDQFSSLTAVTQQVKPERFANYEAGVKWDIRPGLFLSSAIYRLDRTNTRATDPNDPTRIIQTGKQRTDGFEIGLTGNVIRSWSMSGGYSWQNARITSSTTTAVAGKQVAQVPHNMLSLWNKYQITTRLGGGLGLVYRSSSFGAVDNTVVLPGYLLASAAAYYNLSEHWRLQANVDNLMNKHYFANADSNTNISPGAPRNIKIGVTARF